MATGLIQLNPKQRTRLAQRAKKRGKSLAQEVSSAVDLYLSVPPESEAELGATAKAARQAADRMIKRLDETIAYVDRAIKQRRKARK